MLNTKLIQEEYSRVFAQRLRFMGLAERNAPRPKLPWYRRQWNLLRYRISEFRERLGEIVAGRRFDD